MSPYAEELANARLDALRTLIDALNEADTPEEKRRCAVAIFNAPDPCDLDDAIELDDNEDEADENAASEDHHSITQVQSDAEENAATEDAPLQTNPAATSHIPLNFSEDEIIAQATALLNRGEFDHLLSPLLTSSPPP